MPNKRATSIYNFLLVGYLGVGELGDLAEVLLVVIEIFAYGLIRDLTIIVTDLHDSLKDSSTFLRIRTIVRAGIRGSGSRY